MAEEGVADLTTLLVGFESWSEAPYLDNHARCRVDSGMVKVKVVNLTLNTHSETAQSA